MLIEMGVLDIDWEVPLLLNVLIYVKVSAQYLAHSAYSTNVGVMALLVVVGVETVVYYNYYYGYYYNTPGWQHNECWINEYMNQQID